MNWLAHLFLSESSIDFQLANILADPLKARLWESASSDMHKGIKVHKIIDSFTDNNEIVKLSIKRLGKSGLLRAVVIDITYDYLLSKNWNKFSSIPLDMFLKTFYTQAKEKTAFFPVKANVFISNLIDKDILNKYHNLKDLESVLNNVDKRLSLRLLKRETLSSYINVLKENINEIENDFLLFFPNLCLEVKNNINVNNLEHWKEG
ncbi:MAG: DUF479 domain-containing protein [Campylobacteraceae bacterium]|nr:DUF479 domain-containing protein [Campylobacteraceae bacterium]